MFDKLTMGEKAIVLTEFIKKIETINKTGGVVMGTCQILEYLEKIAVENGFAECPCCKRRLK